jgi:hypothetical protein
MAKKRASRTVKRNPTKRRVDVRREEFDRLAETFNQRGDIINALRHDLDIQFKRMAQIQSELDEIQRALQKIGGQTKA